MTNTPHTIDFSGGVVLEFDLADRMKKTLRATGIGVAEMALYLGVTRETVGTWINGRNKPSRATLLAWAQRTGVNMTWLETGQAPTSVTSGPEAVLPRLDSNQQPSGYRSAQVSDLSAYRAQRVAVAS